MYRCLKKLHTDLYAYFCVCVKLFCTLVMAVLVLFLVDILGFGGYFNLN